MKVNLKRGIATAVAAVAALALFSCASTQRCAKSCESDMNGGLNRVVRVYSHDGDLIAEYRGKIDIDDNPNGSVMFDLDGKRYVYYNAIIEIIEE